MMLDRAVLPPLFQRIGKNKPGVPSLYLSNEAYIHIFEQVMEKFGRITKYQMANLLGMDHGANFWRYFNGSRRPASLYLARLFQLELLHDAGFQLNRVKRIDWEPDPIVIYWRNGTQSSPARGSGRWAEIPTPENATKSQHHSTRSPTGPPTALTKKRTYI